MSDIVERLRNYDPTRANSREAAAEIERLQERIEILEAEIRVMRKLPEEIARRMERKP